jgi:hypothetical protein
MSYNEERDMKIQYNYSEIMKRARQLQADAKARFFTGCHEPMLDFGYCLKQIWRGAKADRGYLLDGMTAGGHGLCIVMEG